jgi:hypothetical protein
VTEHAKVTGKLKGLVKQDPIEVLNWNQIFNVSEPRKGNGAISFYFYSFPMNNDTNFGTKPLLGFLG